MRRESLGIFLEAPHAALFTPVCWDRDPPGSKQPPLAPGLSLSWTPPSRLLGWWNPQVRRLGLCGGWRLSPACPGVSPPPLRHGELWGAHGACLLGFPASFPLEHTLPGRGGATPLNCFPMGFPPDSASDTHSETLCQLPCRVAFTVVPASRGHAGKEPM